MRCLFCTVISVYVLKCKFKHTRVQVHVRKSELTLSILLKTAGNESFFFLRSERISVKNYFDDIRF